LILSLVDELQDVSTGIFHHQVSLRSFVFTIMFFQIFHEPIM